MIRHRRRATALSGAALCFLAVAVACRDATELTVRITTGEKCNDLSAVVTVVAGNARETQSRFETRFTTASTRDCDSNGFVGTLVLTPGNDTGSVLVAAGVRINGAPAPDPTTCSDPTVAKSCIVARRSFAFIAHAALMLPIHLDPLCVGKLCDPASTCFKGSCVDASVVCNGLDCGLPDEHPGVGTGGGNEGGSSDGTYDAEHDGTGFEDVADSGGDSAMMGDVRVEAESGVDSGIPSCALSGTTYYCSAPGNGVSTGARCTQMSVDENCCRCTCPNTTVAECGLTGQSTACSNLMPKCQ